MGESVARGRGPSDCPDGLPHERYGRASHHRLCAHNQVNWRLAAPQPIALDLAADFVKSCHSSRAAKLMFGHLASVIWGIFDEPTRHVVAASCRMCEPHRHGWSRPILAGCYWLFAESVPLICCMRARSTPPSRSPIHSCQAHHHRSIIRNIQS